MSKSQVLSDVVQATYDAAMASGCLSSFDLTPLGGMIRQFADETWKHLPYAQRRHTSYEDVEQECRLRIWNAVQSYVPGKGTKLSSWIYGTLRLRMREINAPFTDPTRCAGRTAEMVYLDSCPRREGDDVDNGSYGVELGEETADQSDAIEAFEEVYRESSPDTQQLFLDAMGFRVKVRVASPQARSVALDVATRLRLTENDIRTLRINQSERCLLVAAKVSRSSSSIKLPLIECARCCNTFPVSEAGESIDAKTLVCVNCYEQQAKSSATCFAKASQYDAASPECSKYCPDREVCALVQINGVYMSKIKLVRDTTKPAVPVQAKLPVHADVEEDDPFAESESEATESTPVSIKSGKKSGTIDKLILTAESVEEDEDTAEAVDGNDEADDQPGEPDGDDADALDDALAEPDFGDDDEVLAEPNGGAVALDADDDPFLADETVEEPTPTPQAPKPAQPSRQKEQEPVAKTSTGAKPTVKAASKEKHAAAVAEPHKGTLVPAGKTGSLTVKNAVKSAPKVPAKGVKVPLKFPAAARAAAHKNLPTPKNKAETATKVAVKALAKTVAKTPVKVAVKVVAKHVPAKAAPAKTVAAKAPAKHAGTKPKRVLKPFKPQYWTGQSPFRPGTELNTIFEKLTAQKEVVDKATGKAHKITPGVKLDKLVAYVESRKLNWRGTRHILAKGKSYNGQWEWKFSVDEDSRAKIKVTKRPDAEYRKACGEPAAPPKAVPAKAGRKK